jgi:4-hydroxy-3-polyprenylbenzoate decarboxylase
LLEVLSEIQYVKTHLIISQAGNQTIGLETTYKIKDIQAMADEVYEIHDFTAPIASGSHQTSGMVVIPCSIKSLSAIANSYNNNLLIRSADVTLKEQRKLILVLREAPLHLGHLKLMVRASEIGAVILPPTPVFYSHPESIQDIIDQTVMRVLDLINIKPPTELSLRWGEVKI